MAQPLMPHATAAWLVDNTALSFPQIADFCGLHILEIQAIADDTAATKLTGRDPVRAGELTHDEIDKGQADPDYALQMHKAPDPVHPHSWASLHAGIEAAGQARRQSTGSSATSRSDRRPDFQADRHDADDHRRDPRPDPLELANIQPRIRSRSVTTQRELDAAVTKAQEAAGNRGAGRHDLRQHRAALIEELRAERDQMCAMPRPR